MRVCAFRVYQWITSSVDHHPSPSRIGLACDLDLSQGFFYLGFSFIFLFPSSINRPPSPLLKPVDGGFAPRSHLFLYGVYFGYQKPPKMDHVFGKIPSIKGSQQQRQITQMQKQTHLAGGPGARG